MKDKILAYWNKSSYIMRSVLVYTFFSILAIISKLLDDNLGIFSSMVAIGFLVSMLSVIASVIYAFIMGKNKESIFNETFQAIFVVVLFLFLMSLILPPEVKEEIVEQKKVPQSTRHNVITAPVVEK